MKAKDLLTALQVDALAGAKNLSTLEYIFIAVKGKESNQILVTIAADKIVLTQDITRRPLTLKDFVACLQQQKEAVLYVEDQIIFGFKFVERGIFLG